MRPILCLLIAAAPALAHADCAVDKSVRVTVACTAEMIGTGSDKVVLSDHTQPAPLEVTGPSKTVRLQWDDYALVGELQCAGKSDATMQWNLHVELTKKKLPTPVAYMRIGTPDAAARKGKPPVTATSYYFFEPAIPNPNKQGAKLSRLDYTCELRVE